VIKYLGSKRLLLPHILAAVEPLDGVHTVLDLFSGTSRVAHAFKRAGYRVHANDHNAYAATLARCHVAADARRWTAPAARLVAELNALPGRAGWFTATYCERARFLRPENGARVDAIRDRIEALALEPELEAIVLTSLVEAADRVDSTTGVQMAYLKQWAPRAHKPLELRVPEMLPGAGSASELDARDAAARFEADLVYLDPPYNQHSYLGNYHVWESVVRWDRPEVYGVAMKRTDVRERGSAFNRRGAIGDALHGVLEQVRARWVLLSFNDEGYLALDAVRALLGGLGEVTEQSLEHPRYIGHRIGIYNPRGQKVGIPGKSRNREHLFLVRVEQPAAIDRAVAGAARGGVRPPGSSPGAPVPMTLASKVAAGSRLL